MPVTVVLHVDTPEAMAGEAEEWVGRGFTSLKIKRTRFFPPWNVASDEREEALFQAWLNAVVIRAGDGA